jgi:hypothetical protein
VVICGNCKNMKSGIWPRYGQCSAKMPMWVYNRNLIDHARVSADDDASDCKCYIPINRDEENQTIY